MENKIKVAVMGATGAVGQVFMWMLSDHPYVVEIVPPFAFAVTV